MATYAVSVTETLSLADSVSARLVTDAAYAEWLKADNQERCILVEAELYDVSATADTTRYFSNLGYTSFADDSPASTAYEDILLRVPEIRWSMGELLRGRSLITYGDIEIDNSSGVRDDWLQDAWDNRPIRILLGDKGWHRQDFRLVFSGTIQDIRAIGTSRLALRIRDKQLKLDKVISQTLFSGGGYVTEYQRVPVCYGYCQNVEPLIVNTGSSETFQVHDGAIEDIVTVYKDGYSTGISISENLADGKFTITSPVTIDGRITCDVKGSNASGYVQYPGEIMRRILIDRAGFTDAEIDTAGLATMDVAYPYPIGIFVNDDSTKIVDVLDRIAESIGGYYAIDRDGKFYAAVFTPADPGDTAVVSLTDDDLEQGSLEVIRRIVPPTSVRVGYSRYFTVQKDYLSSSVSFANRARLALKHQVAYAVVTGGAYFQSSEQGPIEESLLVSQTHAQNEANRRKQIRDELHFVYRFRAFLAAQSVKIGDVIALSLSRYGLTSDTKVRVVGIRESMTGGWVELEVYL